MTIEEKAVAYDKIIARANKMHNENIDACKACIEELIPELVESEDEKIRKEVLKAFKIFEEKQAWVGHCLDDIDWDKCIAWLEKQDNLITELQKAYAEIGRLVKENYYLKEKQGEQKPVEWSDKNKEMATGILNYLCFSTNATDLEGFNEWYEWLKSITKEGVLPQSKQEWSEEDECMLKEIISDVKFEGYNNDMQANSYKKINWLKSLRPQKLSNIERNGKNWKPTEKQMYILNWLATNVLSNGVVDEAARKVLYSLYNDLKAL